MLEASAEVLAKDTLKTAVAKGLKAATKIAMEIKEMCTEYGKPKREAPEVATCSEEIISSMKR